MVPLCCCLAPPSKLQTSNSPIHTKSWEPGTFPITFTNVFGTFCQNSVWHDLHEIWTFTFDCNHQCSLEKLFYLNSCFFLLSLFCECIMGNLDMWKMGEYKNAKIQRKNILTRKRLSPCMKRVKNYSELRKVTTFDFFPDCLLPHE